MTRASSVARRYADAYFALAREAGDIAGWRTELAAVAQAFSDPKVADVLVNPKLPLAERTRIGLHLLEGVATPARNLARLLIERKRTALAAAILSHYDQLVDRESGVVRAEVTTALPIDKELESELAKTLSKKLGKPVQTTVVRDASIIGGLVIRIGDRVIDDSVRTRLQQLQAALA